MSDERKALEAYVEVIDVVEFTEYDAETLERVSEFLEGASRLAPGDWTWTEDGEQLWNAPAPYFWQLWHAAKEKLWALGFHPRPEPPEIESDPNVWTLYFHVDEFLNHPPEAVQAINWSYDAFTGASEVRDVPLTDTQKAAILAILGKYNFLVVSEWQWKADVQRLWNYPSETCLEFWQTTPEMLRQSGFHVFSDEKTHILYFNITDTLRKHVSSVTVV